MVFPYAQVATKAGVLNLPEWYDAGAVWIQNNPGTPFGKAPLLLTVSLSASSFSVCTEVHIHFRYVRNGYRSCA